MTSQTLVALQEIILTQLLQPRTLSVRQAGAVCVALEVDDPLDGLNQEGLGELQPYEIELLLSQLFTPTNKEQEACEAALPASGINDAEVEALLSALTATSPHFPLSFGQREQSVPLSEVVIDRYLRLLRLNAAVHPLLLPTLETFGNQDHHDGRNKERWALFSQARNPVWKTSKKAQLLNSFLQAMVARASLRIDKVQFLTSFVRSYRPTGEQGLIQALHNLVASYQEDEEHPVYNQQLEHYQEENIRSEHCGTQVKAFRLAMANALLADFKHLAAPP